MGSHLFKLKLSFWKNWTLFKRNPIPIIFGVIQPSLWYILFIVLRDLATIQEYDPRSHEPRDLSKGQRFICETHGMEKYNKSYIAYSPSSSLFQRIVGSICADYYFYSNNLEDENPDWNASRRQKRGTPVHALEFETATKLNTKIDTDDAFTQSLAAVIQFNDELIGITNIKELPHKLDVTLRITSVHPYSEGVKPWKTDKLYASIQTQIPGSAESKYENHGFLFLQGLVTSAFIKNDYLTAPEDLSVQMNAFPFHGYIDEWYFNNTSRVLIPFFILLSLYYNYALINNGIVIEKEKQLTELMKVMGLPIWCSWLTCFLQNFIILFIAIILAVPLITLKIATESVLRFSDPTVLFVFFMLFACCTISLSFLFSTFFSKANNVVFIGILVYLLMFLPFCIIKVRSDKISARSILALSLLSNSGMGFGMNVILNYEAFQIGVHWDNLWDNIPPIDDIALGPIMLMLLLDSILYFLLALCVEAVFKVKYRVSAPCYFPCSRTYWRKKSTNLETDNVLNRNSVENFETFTGNLPVGIRLVNLSKIFNRNTVVNELNLEMYEGHITVLLGHNGAGKTVTTSIITGLCPPSSGTAIVNGYDIKRDLLNARSSLGMCLQENILFDDLTVCDHLRFFHKLKGLNDKEAQQEIDNYLKISGLEEKKGERSKKLSGGMKRKLCLGIAFCGKSKIVILDEPTSGMDPLGRRMVWDFLQEHKQGRTILLTTHLMDEADVLGDRIAIMTSGQLQCCGSSYFLKRKYGSGYHLIMDIAPECNQDEVTSLLRRHISTVQVQSHAGSELRYRLSEKESPKFEGILSDLERDMTSLSIRSYGLSVAPLGEVFMKVGSQHKNMDQELESNNHKENIGNLLKGFSLIKNQCFAIYLKKAWFSLRIWCSFLFTFCLIIGLLIFASIGNNEISTSNDPPLKISLDFYDEPVTLLSGDQTVYYQIYENELAGFKLNKVKNITATILEVATASLRKLQMRYIVAASFNGSLATAWYNNYFWHSPPLALSLVLNALYKNRFGPRYSINFVNYPLPLPPGKHVISEGPASAFPASEITLLLLEVGLAIFACLFILFCIKERVCKAKHLQFVSGVNIFVFWLTAFLCDFIVFLILICAVLITLAALEINGLKVGDGLEFLAALLIVFAIHLLPFIYLASFLFSHPTTGYFVLLSVGLFSGLIMGYIVLSMEVLRERKQHDPDILNIFLLFVPFYALQRGFMNLNRLYALKKVCSSHHYGTSKIACINNKDCCNIPDYFSMNNRYGVNLVILISSLLCISLFVTVICIDYGFFRNIKNTCSRKKKPVHNVPLETDVQEEYNMIRNSDKTVLKNTYGLVVCDLTKYYKKLLAVNGLCLGVKPFECFGLLGPNGAGKTTTFQMMTGDIGSSYGNIWIHGINIQTKRRKIYNLIGYCPQFDALLDELTVRETLKIFCLIRGVPLNMCKTVKQDLVKKLEISDHLEQQQIKTLSGGNKRKLSVAIAIIGSPPVIYLDEPTTGMDPGSKRAVWSVLTNLRDKGACIILSSHSMEECEALCTRLVIMAHGNFLCLGSIQRLKSKFAQGYSLIVKLKKDASRSRLNDQIEDVDKFIQKNFPGVQLKERYQEQLVYELNQISMPLSHMFGILEKHKSELNIEDYSLGQCSLEKVFLNLTEDQ